MPLPNQSVNLFIAFSPADTELKNELEEHLSILQRQGYLNVWHNQKIEAGENQNERETEELANSQIILLLISSDFLASDYAYENEILKALDRHKQGTARVIPVILRDCLWKTGTLGQLAPLPTGGKPVTEWDNPDAAFKNIAAEIQKMVSRFSKQSNNWVYDKPGINDTNTGVNKKMAAFAGFIALFLGLIASTIYFKYQDNNPEDVKGKLLKSLQGDWVNPKNDDSFIHRLQFTDNYVGVFSLGQNEELYWGEQEVQVVSARKCKVDYEGLSFDIEVVNSTLFDTLVESLVAIYRIDTPGILGLRNSKLLRQETLQLLAMRDTNNQKSVIDTPKFVLKSETIVNLNELNLTPRMILEVDSLKTDSSKTRVSTTKVRKAIEQRFLQPNLFDSAQLKTDNEYPGRIKITDPIKQWQVLNPTDTTKVKQVKILKTTPYK